MSTRDLAARYRNKIDKTQKKIRKQAEEEWKDDAVGRDDLRLSRAERERLVTSQRGHVEQQLLEDPKTVQALYDRAFLVAQQQAGDEGVEDAAVERTFHELCSAAADDVKEQVARSYPQQAKRDHVRATISTTDLRWTEHFEQFHPGDLVSNVTLAAPSVRQICSRGSYDAKVKPVSSVKTVQALASSYVLRESIGLSSLATTLVNDWCEGDVAFCGDDCGYLAYLYRRWRSSFVSETEMAQVFERVLGVGGRRQPTDLAGRRFSEGWTRLIEAAVRYVIDERCCPATGRFGDLHVLPLQRACRELAASIRHAATGCDRWLATEIAAITEVELMLFDDLVLPGICQDDRDRSESIEHYALQRQGRTISVADAAKAAELTHRLVDAVDGVDDACDDVDDLVTVAWELAHVGATTIGQYRPMPVDQRADHRPAALTQAVASTAS